MTDQKENIDWKENFKNEFVLYLIRNGERPVTVFKFCEELGVDESLFYKYYNSFRSVEKEVWLTFYQEVKQALGQGFRIFFLLCSRKVPFLFIYSR